ncbi:MAG: ATP-binding protein [Candidatus Methanomethylicia archaeon]|nr:ATP-binding protein [Candidatus Methanomethylicia archaeon]
MIKKMTIENFRSIKSQEIKLGPINAFVGPNNAGKSNIMKALNLVLGDTYPSARSFDEKDLYNYDKSKPIKIEVRFDPHFVWNKKEVYGFRLTFDGTNCEYLAVDSKGNAVTYPFGRGEVRVTNEMKNEVALMYLGLERLASHRIRATQWTLYGKLLRHIERGIGDSEKQNFKSSIEESYESNIHPHLQQMEDILKAHVKNQTGLDLHLRLSVMDPIETIKNLRPYL